MKEFPKIYILYFLYSHRHWVFLPASSYCDWLLLSAKAWIGQWHSNVWRWNRNAGGVPIPAASDWYLHLAKVLFGTLPHCIDSFTLRFALSTLTAGNILLEREGSAQALEGKSGWRRGKRQKLWTTRTPRKISKWPKQVTDFLPPQRYKILWIASYLEASVHQFYISRLWPLGMWILLLTSFLYIKSCLWPQHQSVQSLLAHIIGGHWQFYV